MYDPAKKHVSAWSNSSVVYVAKFSFHKNLVFLILNLFG